MIKLRPGPSFEASPLRSELEILAQLIRGYKWIRGLDNYHPLKK